MGALLNPLDESHDSDIGLTEWDGFWVIREVFFDMKVYGVAWPPIADAYSGTVIPIKYIYLSLSTSLIR